MIGVQDERSAKQIHMERLDSPDYCQSFFVNLRVPLLSFCECPGSKSMQWVAQSHHSSRGIARHRFPQGMHHKEASVADWDHSVLILALRSSFLSRCRILFRIVPSIATDGCSLTTGSKGVPLLTDWARIC